MKKSSKILSGVCAFALAACLGTTAFAAESPIQGDGSISDGTLSKDVNVTVTQYVEAAKKYYVAIDLTDLEYTYNKGSEGTWDATSMKYNDAAAAGWTDNGAKTFHVKNQSNDAIDVTAAWEVNGTNAQGLTMKITHDGEQDATAKHTIEKATAGVGGENGTATEKEYTATLSGEPQTTGTVKAGTITLTVAAHSEDA